MREYRYEVNVDVAKADIDWETVRKVIEQTLRERFVHLQYITVQSVKTVRAK
jgi:acetone carboxylase gamma subunit